VFGSAERREAHQNCAHPNRPQVLIPPLHLGCSHENEFVQGKAKKVSFGVSVIVQRSASVDNSRPRQHPFEAAPSKLKVTLIMGLLLGVIVYRYGQSKCGFLQWVVQ
jgi:hypothetical protein